jgi:hypothetical protein
VTEGGHGTEARYILNEQLLWWKKRVQICWSVWRGVIEVPFLELVLISYSFQHRAEQIDTSKKKFQACFSF